MLKIAEQAHLQCLRIFIHFLGQSLKSHLEMCESFPEASAAVSAIALTTVSPMTLIDWRQMLAFLEMTVSFRVMHPRCSIPWTNNYLNKKQQTPPEAAWSHFFCMGKF